ncbi:LysR family transcriptional regulator [Geotalea sp. SG265]|uniref:LysR family transcriptional regulator n=1 Tax=Geotalea sp. SG265 TaxID=2922867 RepID=UPI001FAF6A97|nr:LysR family transcriptional regulator [Geotalea sp. SG265]
MDFTYLKTLLILAKVGSFSKAALSLCVTQSAVSRRIQCLEEHYGQVLLDRSGPALKPTRAGEILIAKAAKVLDIEREMIKELQAQAGRRKKSFCCTFPFGTSYLPGILKEFMATHAETSEMSFVFEMPEVALQGLKDGIFDLVLIEYCEELNLSAFKTFPLPDDEMIFVSSPKRGITGKTVPIETLLKERLYCKKAGCCARRFLDKSMLALGRSSSDFTNTVFFDDIPFIIDQVMADEGITFISRSMVGRQLDEGTLVAYHAAGFAPSRARSLVLNEGQKIDPILLDFIHGIYRALNVDPPESLSSAAIPDA